MNIYEVRDITSEEIYHPCGLYSSLEKAKEAIDSGFMGNYSPEDYNCPMELEIHKHTVDDHSTLSKVIYSVTIAEVENNA
jgi:hypothetical protein